MSLLSPPVHAVSPPCELGESPFWHPDEQCLYWCDVKARCLHRLDPLSGASAQWSFESDLACCAPRLGGGLVLAMRDGLWSFDPRENKRYRLCAPPYDPAVERFNDGKCDAQGRLWVGTLYEPRDAARAALYCLEAGQPLVRRAADVTNANGLAWSPDGRTLYWADTAAHVVYAFDFDPIEGLPTRRRVFKAFERRIADQPLAHYGGRPDGAAVDEEGCYWLALYEGARLVRLSPRGDLLASVPLPVQCPTMPCFGGPDLRTLFVTTARSGRPADELAQQPMAGCVLSLRMGVRGLPAQFFHG